MIEVVSVENMRKSDAYTIANITPSLELMRRAGEGVFKSVKNWREPIAIVCGSGNNAGDGYVLAKLLYDAGLKVSIILCEDRFSKDGRYYFEICKAAGIEHFFYSDKMNLTTYATIVDCIFGTGFKGKPKAPYNNIIEEINEAKAFVISVDINSGLNGDSGIGSTYVISDYTVSIGNYKPGHFLNMAKDAMKDKTNVDIGIEIIDSTYELLEAKDIKALLPDRRNFSNKGDFGYVGLIGGCLEYSGAIRLASMAATTLRSGAGVVSVALPSSLSFLVAQNVLEATVYPLSDKNGHIIFVEEEFQKLVNRYRCLAIGMGIGTGEEISKCITYILETYKGQLIIDADGLNILSKLDKKLIRECEAKLVLTPHLKELTRLAGCTMEDLLEDYIGTAVRTAVDYNAVLLLKGPCTLITDGNKVFMTDKGCPGMATAGSGDVLSGITAALLSCNQGQELLATAAAAYINGMAGEKAAFEHGEISMIASDTIKALSTCIL